MQSQQAADSGLRRRIPQDNPNQDNNDNTPSTNSDTNANAETSKTLSGTTATTTVTSTTTSTTTASGVDTVTDNKVYYNGRAYEGTGRLPRDAPFTPTYVNAYTFNSAVAFVSLVVTASFFYFKIIAGLLDSPQVGPTREFQSTFMGPPDQGELRPMVIPLCPLSSVQQQQQQPQSNQGQTQKGFEPIADQDDCLLFGKIVVLADSISKYGYTHATHGWIGSLADEWAGRADVILRGFPGYNTHWIKSIFPDLLHQESKSAAGGVEPVKLVVVALGTDDASFPHTRQHVALGAYKENLRSIISSIRFPDSPNYSPHTQVVLVTPAPVHDVMWEASVTAANKRLDRSNNVTKEYADACVEVGQELKVPVVNLWSDIQCQVEGTCMLHESTQLEDYIMDGLHLKRMGNDVLYKGILNAVAEHYPQLHPVCWPTIFPGYNTESSTEQSVHRRYCNHHNSRR